MSFNYSCSVLSQITIETITFVFQAGASSTPKGSENINPQSEVFHLALNNLPLKKRLNMFDGHHPEQGRCTQSGFLFARPAEKVDTRDASTQTDDDYFKDINDLYTQLKVLREQIQKAGFATHRKSSTSSGSGEEETQNSRESESTSTSSNEAARICPRRKAKANNVFCNGNTKVSVFESMRNYTNFDSIYSIAVNMITIVFYHN